MEYKGLPIFDVILTKNSKGIKATSLVATPAIESNFLNFDEDKPMFMFAKDEKNELIGAIMIPDQPIYRNINGKEFYVNFKKEVIKEIVDKAKEDESFDFTVAHKYDVAPEAIEVVDVWVKEGDDDKSMNFGIEEPVGSAFMHVKINDEKLLKEVQENGLNGFSIELGASVKEYEGKLDFQEDKKETMNFKEMFDNSIEANGVELLFNKEMKVGTPMFVVVDEKLETYDGKFSKDEVEYTVNNGVISEVQDINLSMAERVQSLSTEFSAVKESIDTLLAAQKDLESAQAEFEAQKEQFENKVLEFEKNKEKSNETEDPNKVFLELAKETQEWLGKFKVQ